jgi:hypothetical protein
MTPGEPETIEVIVKLSPEAAAGAIVGRNQLESIVAELGTSLQPLHPETADPELSTWFAARVPTGESQAAIQRLLGADAVEAAYAKPRGEPPERSTRAL